MSADTKPAESAPRVTDAQFERCVEAVRWLKWTGELTLFVPARGGIELVVEEPLLAEAAEANGLDATLLQTAIRGQVGLLMWCAALDAPVEAVLGVLAHELGEKDKEAATVRAQTRLQLVADRLVDDDVRQYARRKLERGLLALSDLGWDLFRPVDSSGEADPPIARIALRAEQPVPSVGLPSQLQRVLTSLVRGESSAVEMFCDVNDVRYLIRRLTELESEFRRAEGGPDGA